MIIISHRGNLHGPNGQKENSIEYVIKALKLFNVEIDVWFINNSFYLGHDYPNYPVKLNFLKENSSKLWVHCKNIEALQFLKNEDINCFGHNLDKFVLTSKGFIFTCPGEKQSKDSVCVMPESINQPNFSDFAICTDYPFKYSNDTLNNVIGK